MAKLQLSPLTQRLMAGLGPAPADASLPGGASVVAAVPAPAARRTKLWELGDKHHCPVIGTCIPMADLARFAKRFRFTASLRDQFALHVEMVGHSRSRNEISEALQRHLDREYQGHLERFARLKTDAEVLAAWQESLARGDVAGPLWAAYSHRACSNDTRQQIYGDIHMLSHQVGAGQAADARRLGHLEKENAQLKAALARQEQEAQAQLEILRRENAALAREAAAARALLADNEALGERLAAFRSGEVVKDLGRKLLEVQAANQRLATAAGRAGELEQALKAAQEEGARLARERDAAQGERRAMASFLTSLAAADGSCSGSEGEDCAACPQALSSRCILYVGGRASMIAQYRQLADRLGIRLIHHDGGQEESLSRLPELIHGADAVVCPTDNISHSAYYQVKSHCKRVGKPCLFYTGTGVSSFAMAMTRISRGEYSLAPGAI